MRILSDILANLKSAKSALTARITEKIGLSTYKQSCSFLNLSINDKDCKGSTLLHDAVYKGKIDLVRIILMQSDVLLTLIDSNGYTPFHYAANHKDTNMLELLVAKLASQLEWPSLTNEHQALFGPIISTPHYFSSEISSLDHPINSKDAPSIWNRSQDSIWASLLSSDCGQQVRKLLESVHLRNPYNRQLPIHQAALNSSTECSKILISKLVSPIAPRDCNDQTPLQLSAAAMLANPPDQQCHRTGNEYPHESVHSCKNLFLKCPSNTSHEINKTECWSCEDWFDPSINRAQCTVVLQQVARKLSDGTCMKTGLGNSVFLVRQECQNLGCLSDQAKLDARSNFILSIATLPCYLNSDSELALSELDVADEQFSRCQQNEQPAVYHYKIDHVYPTDHLIQKWLSDETLNDHTCCVSRTVAEYYGPNVLFFIHDGPYFRSLCELIFHHRIYADGLKGTLHFPVFQNHPYIGMKHNEPTSNTYDHTLNLCFDLCLNSDFQYPNPISISNNASEVGIPFSDKVLSHRLTKSFTNIRGQYEARSMPDVMDGKSDTECSARDPTLAVNRIGRDITHTATNVASPVTTKRCKHLPIIEISKLQISKMLGRGEFGCVWEATYIDERNSRISVAVKILNDVSLEGRRNFLREALIMSELRHSCLVRIFGIVNDVNLMIVQELLPKGSLLNFCKTRQLPDIMLNVWAIQMAKGMEYMERKNVVHRDLAARNVLVSSHYQVKISDFGLSRVAASNQTYTQNNFGPAPIKWYAPESIEFALFTSKSDVWSYGVTLWEMFSAGKLPYGSMHTASEILHFLKRNNRLEKPLRCSKTTYNLMTLAWIYDYRKRPSFVEINKFFILSSEYKESLQKIKADQGHNADKLRFEHF